MKKTILIIGLILLCGTYAYAQTSGTIPQLNPWRVSGTTITPVVNTNSLTVPQLGGSGTKCLHVNNAGLFSTATSDCGSGGGSGGGTWSTTTSTVSGQLFNYPNNATDIVTIGSNSSTTAEFFFDPNTNLFKTVDIVTKSPYVDARYYTSLSAAVTAIGTATSTLLVPNSQNITSNLTIPANITLKFIGTGMLNLSNGVTVTILGEIDAPFKQIFNNAINYVATTSFSGNVMQKTFQTAWWGTPNSWSTDATPYLQAGLNALPFFSKLVYPQGQKMALCNTLHMDYMGNVSFEAIGERNTITPNYGIRWCGPDGGTMITMRRTAGSKIANHTFIASTTSAAAGKVIDIDGGSGEPGFTSTNDWVVDNLMPTSPASTTFKAISISETAITNNEFMHIIGNIVTGAGTFQGTGLYMGLSSNAHGHIIEGNTFYDFKYNIHSENGSFDGIFNNFGGADYDLYIEDVSYPSTMRYSDSENSRHFAYINASYPLKIENSRIMGPGYAGDGFVVFGYRAKYVTFDSNIFGGDDSAYTYDASGAGNLHLTSTNNRFASSPTKTEAENYHGFYPPVQGATLTRNDPGFYTATSTTWANQQIVRDVTLSYPSPGLNAGDIHLGPSGGGHVPNNSNSITFGANSSGYYDQAVAGIYVQTSQNPPTNSTMYFGTTNSYSSGPQIGMTLSPTRNLGIGTTSPYAKLSVVGQTVAAYFTATTSAASTFPYASSTALTVSGALYNSGLSDGCLNVTSGLIGSTGSACGSGGGGGTGAWSTTTVATGLIVYPNNNTDVVNIGSNSTSTGSFWFNPITQVAYIKRLGVNQNIPSATYALDITGQLRTTQVATLNELNLGAGWAYWAQGAAGGIGLGSGHNIAWKSSTTNTGNTGDVGLSRYGAGVLALGNGTAGNATGTLITSVIGVGTTSPYAMLSVAGQVVGQYFTATSTTQASTFPYASSTAFTSDYASSTRLMTTGHQVYSTYDKSLWAASSTLDATYKSFNTATSTWIVWNPSIATAAENVYCKTDTGTATLEMGNGTASTTAICSSSGVESVSTVTWASRSDVFFAIKTLSGNPNKVTATGKFYAQ